jgi:hypothetical protein
VTKFSYEAVTTSTEMELAEYTKTCLQSTSIDTLEAKNVIIYQFLWWAMILLFLLLSHFCSCCSLHRKVYGQHGKLTEKCMTSCSVINHMSEVNKFAVPHSKVQGESFWFMVESWIENFLEMNQINHYFQGDGYAGTVTEVLAAGISHHILMNGTQKASDQVSL